VKRLAAALALLAALALAAFAAGCSTAGVEAGLVLGDLAAGQSASTYKRLTPRPQRQSVSYAIDGRSHGGDLYLPAEKARAGLVLVPGAAREGKDHPLLVSLAQTLARARYLVLVPDIPSLRALEVSADDRHPIADAVRYLDAGRHMEGIGIAAISYAAAPAILAALDEPKVDFVVTVGGTYDLTAILTFFTTGHYREGPGLPWQRLEPNAYGKWVFVKSNARRLDDSADRALLAAIADRKLAQLDAPVTDLAARLSPQGRAVMALLDNDDPDRVPALIAALPPRIRGEIARMDLAPKDLSKLKAHLYLIHGRDDRIIPWTESAALARMAPSAELTLLDNLAHAELKPGGAGDTLALWRMVAHLLTQRDRLSQRGS
jgi:pimeloyl-ACP methyl ester carboxylesterase